jgi:hypothetical protein
MTLFENRILSITNPNQGVTDWTDTKWLRMNWGKNSVTILYLSKK